MDNVEYLDNLNAPQREAVMHTEGPALVIAGAGSGKTRVLTMRIAHLLDKGVRPWNILALTFTNKAAREMKERIARIVGDEQAGQLWMGTFHSIFARILRIEAEATGFAPTFSIYDTTDSKSLVHSIIKEMHLDDKEYKPSLVLGAISAAKNDLIMPAAYAHSTALTERDKASRRPKTAEIYMRYMRECRKANAMDFDDLLLYTNVLFRDRPDVLEKYQDRFRYVLVDEYQDTNMSQYLIVKKLVEKHRNLCVVGDDAQSIYSFRGAKIENILNFRNDYADYRLFKLEQNYRSTQNIVNVANGIIAHNRGQIQKTVFSENDEGSKVRVFRTASDFDEAMTVINDINRLRRNCGYAFSDFAILYRTNAQSRAFEDELRKCNMPYRIVGGQAFYQRKEIKDTLAYMRVAVNPNDSEALRRIINYPARGIGAGTVDKLTAAAAAADTSLWNVMAGGASLAQCGLNGPTTAKIARFCALCASMAAATRQLSAYEFAADVVSRSGIMQELAKGKDDGQEGKERIENVNELLNSIKDFTDTRIETGQPATIADYLEEVSLVTDLDSADNGDPNHITLMTIHSSKGLEFKNVYIVGVEEDIFPGQISATDPRAIEEERRLFYVAVTRAETNATISYTQSRFQYGKRVTCRPSRFVAELDERFVEMPGDRFATAARTQFRRPDDSARAFSFSRPDRTPAAPQRLRPVAKAATPPDTGRDQAGQYSVGTMVMHERFGQGIVRAIDGTGADTKLTIEFVSAGTKHLLVKFARLKLL